MKTIFTRTRRFLLAAALLIACGYQANAQLVAGDILFTSYNTKGSAGNDTFTFVLMKALPPSTTINFTDRGYGGSSYNADNGSSETSIRWVSGNAGLPIGTEIRIVGLSATVVSTGAVNGVVTTITGTVGLSLTGLDQIIAYTGTIGSSPLAIAGIHWNNCSGNTNTATWDIVGPCATVTGVSGSTMPPGLSNANAAMWAGLTGGVARLGGKFMCSGTPTSNVDTLRKRILDNANWSFITSTGEALSVPNGCTYYGATPPEITTDPSPVSVCANSPTSFSITANNATSYKWQVKIGSAAFTDVPNAGVYSGATTTTLSLSSAPASANGYQYRAVAINSGGGDTSTAATLTVANGVPSFTTQPSDAAICPAGSTIISAAASNATSYVWQVNTGSGFTNITDGGVYSNATTASLTITSAPNNMYGYQYRLAATNACGTANSSAATLTFRNTWTGASSTVWNLAGNWSCNRVPDTLTDVVIGTATNQPVITTAAAARNITINTGGNLSFSGSNSLSVAGTIINLGGTFTATSTNATVVFNSIRPNQSIPAGTYYNIQFNGSGDKVLAGDITVNNNANIVTNNKVFLGSNTITFGPTGTLSSGSSARYFVCNGTGGIKKMNLTGSFTFQMGTVTSYTPFLINNSGGTPDNFTGREVDNVYTEYVNDVPQGAPITSKVVNKTWFITEDVPGGSNAQMIVQWNASDEAPSFDRRSITFSHYVNGDWVPSRLQGATNSTSAGPYLATLNNITSFSPFGLGNIPSPLPLNLLAFTGNKQTEGVALKWETADEKNIQGFVIERAVDGEHFEATGLVAALNIPTANSYQFLDKTAPASASRLYYRLRINEQDGTHNYSQTVMVYQDNNKQAGFYASPNPVKGDVLSIHASAQTEGPLTISVIDMAGKEWSRTTATISAGNSIPVNLKAIPAGNYVLKLTNGAATETIRFVRQ